jgi:SAM-dependent methyltransferase
MSLWDFKAIWYGPLRSLVPARWILSREIRLLKGLMDRQRLRPSVALDIGTGVGADLDIYSSCTTVIGLDRSWPMIRRVRIHTRIVGIVGDAQSLPFLEGRLPFVSSIGLTEYLSDKRAFLREVKRVLCKEGRFLVTIARPNIWNGLRCLLGHRIRMIRPDLWTAMTQDEGFVCLAQARSFLQSQYLFQATNH